MFNLIEKRRYFFIFSTIVIIAGVALMIYSTVTTGQPFHMGIDFVGGSVYELKFTEAGATENSIREVFAQFGQENVVLQQLGEPEDYRWSVRAGFNELEEQQQQLIDALDAVAPLDRDSLRVERVSATIGQEVTRAAFFAVIVATVVVTGFIVIAFRQVPNALRYGVCAILAMLHDVLIVLSIMAFASLLFGWEIDALFLTAVLTVVGFSVQDTIVLFDRIRENIPKHLGEPYETIVNRSVLETIHRSLATQLNAFFIMIAILLFGGETIKQFIAVLAVGFVTGTYSSIFIAVPLLVSWQKGEIPFVNQHSGVTSAVRTRREDDDELIEVTE
ncbi:MAG: protein translocase subunit SecF [Burkholderiales bacterium]|nr:protein translocase subunit SecF [Anaerolineae bacterium]